MDNKEKLKKLFNRLIDRMGEIVLAFSIVKTLQASISINKVGKEAIENADILNQHKYFFIITKLALINFVIINLNKFFDKDKRTISVNNLVKELEKHKFIDECKSKEINKFINNDNNIQEIKKVRDKLLAHENIVEVIEHNSELKLPPLDKIELLINKFQEIFNELAIKFDKPKTWQFLKDRTEEQTIFLIKSLKIAKRVRIDKIKNKKEG